MILIKGGKIKPITGAEIENGELLIGDDGKIAAIGKTVDAPADAKVIDATGCLVTPGFIDAHCHIGIDEEGMRWEGNDCNEYSSPVTLKCALSTASIPATKRSTSPLKAA